ncbi:MAG: arylamine N-acetyltransferase family protein [Parasphingopyxis sp.]|uniref:arylamine N-acetyltransferase family protein n=1 Tax=Parasphingopyxis sp. TaxID=1920299 RepID=UPI003FA0120D
MDGGRPSERQVGAYLDRIGFVGTPRADLATLAAVHRGHVENIPWENIDVALGRPLTRDPGRAFDKLVTRGRGGWCYEMNGLLGWMLEALGFRVAYLAGGVNRAGFGDEAIGNHLVLLVELDRSYIADTGFGTGLIEPVALEAGEIAQGPARFRLERLDETWWRFHNHDGLMPPSFDFGPTITDDAKLEARCQWLQSNDSSPFRKRVIVNAHRDGRLEMLDLPVLRTLTEAGLTERQIGSPEELAELLSRLFGRPLPEAGRLWDKMAAAEA